MLTTAHTLTIQKHLTKYLNSLEILLFTLQHSTRQSSFPKSVQNWDFLQRTTTIGGWQLTFSSALLYTVTRRSSNHKPKEGEVCFWSKWNKVKHLSKIYICTQISTPHWIAWQLVALIACNSRFVTVLVTIVQSILLSHPWTPNVRVVSSDITFACARCLARRMI